MSAYSGRIGEPSCRRFGNAGERHVEYLSLFGPQRMHVRARPGGG
jgi:hypothetical protein